jgi:salicylate biosynthesis isochorismate synthase/menaquinone-specific isochorismate synthase
MPTLTAARPPFALPPADRARLRSHLEAAIRRARVARSGRALAAVTVALDPRTDPTAVVVASRRAGEPWFVLEQPDRERSALATLGCVEALEARGPDRFREVAALWRRLVSDACCDADDDHGRPRGSGPVAVGGFAFAPEGGRAPHWGAFAPASLHVPEVALARRGGDVRMTVHALARPTDTVDGLLGALEARCDALRIASLPLLDPDPAGRARVVSAMPPEHYEGAVARGVERIRAGALQKVVLAREVQVHAGRGHPHDAGAVLGVLREAFPSCYVFAVGRGDATFVAASPELLVRRDGLRAGTLALAGSARRSADPAVDDHLGEQLLRSAKDRGEQEIVTRRIERALRRVALWVTVADEPQIVKMANIQHLATPIRAQLAERVPAVALAGLLHPTPAVGGEPWAAAAPLIPALEGLDRGWYAGPVGWTDLNEDGEFCVALRCALLEGPVARCYAGVGVVHDSEPAAELAETETKLQALLPILAL